MFKIIFAIFLTLFWLAAAPAASVKLTPTAIQNTQYYRMAQVAQRLNLKYSGNATRVELSNANGNRLIFYPNKRFASINGIQVTLDFAPAWKNGGAYLSVSDFKYLIEPIFSDRALKGKRPGVIVIDPGHGGTDRGASGKKSSEKYLTLLYAKKLQNKLAKLGYQVSLTRTGDQTLTLKQRSQIARSRGARLFISIHMNATKTASVAGIETFALTPAGAPSSGDSKPKSTYYRGNSMAGDSGALAYSVQRALVRALKPTDRGVKRARFVVLTDVSCPAILLECGFLSNAAEEKRLNSASHQDKFINALASGIQQFAKRLPEK